MKAIHNLLHAADMAFLAVNYTQRYKKWKQFTTNNSASNFRLSLWTIHKDTKNESNSQLKSWAKKSRHRCELYTKIQKMKAIHNRASGGFRITNAVNYTQRYKKWKQFTTACALLQTHLWLWTIHKDTKNESNSQQYPPWSRSRACCELYTKIQKMKAIHNHVAGPLPLSNAVNYTQRYKKWKQFTTVHVRLLPDVRCELYTKIQKMKAIHNTN